MAFKKFVLDEHTEVKIYKRKASRSLKLSVAADGSVRVSIPHWTPYQAGLSFARSRAAWIRAQQRPQQTLQNGQLIGKAHHLRLIPTSSLKPTTRLLASEIIVRYPFESALDDSELQAVIVAACERALRKQAEQLLPTRLAELAKQHDYTFKTVTIKKLKSRWGSCDQHQNIVLNLYLMNLPWELIDYVLLHELTHTKILKHGPDFWQGMETKLPTVKQSRRAIRGFQPTLWPVRA